jgi:hypothetical protein
MPYKLRKTESDEESTVLMLTGTSLVRLEGGIQHPFSFGTSSNLQTYERYISAISIR